MALASDAIFGEYRGCHTFDIPRPCRDTGPPSLAGFVFLGVRSPNRRDSPDVRFPPVRESRQRGVPLSHLTREGRVACFCSTVTAKAKPASQTASIAQVECSGTGTGGGPARRHSAVSYHQPEVAMRKASPIGRTFQPPTFLDHDAGERQSVRRVDQGYAEARSNLGVMYAGNASSNRCRRSGHT